LLAYTKFTFKEFRVCVRAIFAFAGGYKLGERYLLGELERRLLPLRLALRPLRQALRYPWLCAPSVDPSGDLRTSRQSVRPVLGGIGLEFPDHGKLRRRPGLQHRIVPNPDPRDGRRCGFHLRQCGSRVFTGDRRLDCDFPFDCGGAALLALSFFLLVPMFLFVARETTRKELADFVGQRT
jgi:hypothetical protein